MLQMFKERNRINPDLVKLMIKLSLCGIRYMQYTAVIILYSLYDVDHIIWPILYGPYNMNIYFISPIKEYTANI